MRREVSQLARRYIDGINLGFRNATDLAAVCIECFAVRTPRHGAPGVALVGFTRQLAYFLGTPVEQSDVIVGGLLGLTFRATVLPSRAQSGPSSRTSGVLVRFTGVPPSLGTAYKSHK